MLNVMACHMFGANIAIALTNDDRLNWRPRKNLEQKLNQNMNIFCQQDALEILLHLNVFCWKTTTAAKVR